MTTVRSRLAGLGAVGLLALLAASVGVSVYVYHARTPDLALEVKILDPKFAPSANGNGERARISYFVRYDEPHSRVEIVGRNKALVRTVDSDLALRDGERMLYRWDGLTDEGKVALPGRYRLRVVLPSVGRDMIYPRRITVEPASFKPQSRSAGKPPGGQG